MDAESRLLVIEQGRTFREHFAIDVPGEGTLNPSGVITRAQLSVRDKHTGDLLLQLTTENGGILLGYYQDTTDGMFWTGYCYATAAATGSLIPWGDAVYDMYVEYFNGEKDTLWRGPAVLIPRVAT